MRISDYKIDKISGVKFDTITSYVIAPDGIEIIYSLDGHERKVIVEREAVEFERDV